MLLTSQKNLFSFATVAKVFTDEAGFGLLAHSLVLRAQNCGVKSSGGRYGISLINAAPTPYRPFPTQKKKILTHKNSQVVMYTRCTPCS